MPSMTIPLRPDALRRICRLEDPPFESSADLEALAEIVAQDRAVQAITFGVGIRSVGLNLFALGGPGTGRATAVRRFLSQEAATLPTPPDWCYVNNFADSHQPRGFRGDGDPPPHAPTTPTLLAPDPLPYPFPKHPDEGDMEEAQKGETAMKEWAASLSVLFFLVASDQVLAQILPDKPVQRVQPVRPAPAGTFPLRCRGGAVRAIGFQQFSQTASRLTVSFKRGSKPAPQGLNPGECSWLDRGLRDAEPASICHDVTDVFLSTTHNHNSQYAPPDLQLLQSAWSKSAPYLEKVRDPNSYFTVHVKAEGTCLAVKSLP